MQSKTTVPLGRNPGSFWVVAMALVVSMLPVGAAALTASTTSLARSPNPSTFGQAVTLTATVSPGAASGKVTFYDGVTVLGTRTLSSGQATLTTSLLPSGSRSLKAYYGGDATYAASTSATVAQTVVAAPQNGFLAAVNYNAATYPTSVAVGDFNGDGKADLAVADTNSNNVSVLRGNGDGTFQAAVNYNVGTNPYFVAVGDFNGDGKADLAVANYNSNNVSVLLGNGDGTFQAAVNYNAGRDSEWVAVGDFNGDGKADLAVTNYVSNNVSVLLGNGDGTFQAAVNYNAGTNSRSVAVGDFNGDGKADLAVANFGSGNVSVLRGNGDGTFQAAVNYNAGTNPYSVTVGDFNGDGKSDLAVVSDTTNNVSVLLGNGDGTFQAAVNYSAGFLCRFVAVGDFNGDGKADLVVTPGNPGGVSVLLGNGDGTFQAPVNYNAGDGPFFVAVGDFNGDGRADLAVANTNSNNVSILLGTVVQTCTFSITPTSQSFTSASGTGSVTVTTATGCTWTATSNASSITITSGSTGAGNGTVNYSVAVNNTTSSLSGTLTIAGQTFTVTQSGATLSVSSANLTFAALAGGANPNTQTLQVTASAGSSLSWTATATSTGGNWLSISPTSGTTPGSISASVSTAGLAAGTYTGQITVTPPGGSPTTVSVTLTVATFSVSPSSSTFTALAGGGNPSSQTLQVTVSGGPAVSWTATAASTGGNWLSISPQSGTTQGNITVSVNTAGLAAGTYTGQITVTPAGGSPTTVSVTLTVATFSVSPSSLTFTPPAGGGNPSSQTLQVSVSGGPAVSWTATAASTVGNWLSISPQSGTTPGNITVSVNTAGLAAGNYTGQVAVTPAGGSAATVSVTLNLSSFSVSPLSLAFTAQAGSGNPSSQTLQVTFSGSQALSWTATAASTGGNWLSISPASGTTPGSISVSVNTAGLAAGTFTGQVAVTPAGGSPTTVSVTLNLFTLSVSPSSLSFTAQAAGPNPSPQTLQVTASAGPAVSWTATATSTGSNWLSISPQSGTTPGNISVSASTGGLAGGTYTGQVTVTPVGGSPTSISVTLNLITFSVSSSSLNFTALVGGGNPSPQTLQVTASGGPAVSWTAAATSTGGNWLSIFPVSGTTPGTISVSANTAGLAEGSYTGQIAVTPAGGSPATVLVTLNLFTLGVTPSSLTFNGQAGGSNPNPQTLQVTVSGGPFVPWTAAATTSTGGNWLSIFPQSGSTPAPVTASASLAGLAVGTYQGQVSIQSGQISRTVAVTLVVQTPTAQLTVQPSTLSFQGQSGTVNPPPQNIDIRDAGGGNLVWSATVSTSTGGNWLAVNPSRGTTPALAQISVGLIPLAPGSYQGSVLVEAQIPGAAAQRQTVTVNLSVQAGGPAKLTVDPEALTFEIPANSTVNPPAEALRVGNAGAGDLSFVPRASTLNGGSWLVIAPSSTTARVDRPATLQVIANAIGLPAGLYSGQIDISSSTTGETKSVRATLRVARTSQSILTSQAGLLFTGVQGGGTVPPQSFGILNVGQGQMDWTVETEVLSPSGGQWLRVSRAQGTSTGNSADIPLVEVQVDVTGLAAGQYSGLIRVKAAGADNTPQTLSVDLTVLPQGSRPPASVRPLGLIFAAPAGGAAPFSRTVRIATSNPVSVSFSGFSGTFQGSGWLSATPLSGTISPASPQDITVQANPAGLPPGIYKGAVTLGSFTDGATPTQTVDVLFQVLAAAAVNPASIAHAAAGCAPQKVQMAGRVLGGNFAVSTGYPNTIEVELQDDCGNPVPDPNSPNPVPATVFAGFSNGDPQLPLVYAGTPGSRGVYQNSWRPTLAQSSVTVTVRAIAPPALGLQPGELSISGSVANNPAAPAIFGGGIVGAAGFVPNTPLAPGGIISVFGRNLAANQAGASVLPLPKSLARASLNIGGIDVPLFYANDGQINAQLPAELPSGTRLQAAVTRLRPDGTPEIRTFPETITLSAASPGIFTVSSDGKGQGAILIGDRVANAASPAVINDVVVVYCTGLGATNPAVLSGTAAPSSPLSTVTNPVTVTVGGMNAPVEFAGLSPGFAGLYQVNVRIPSGVPPGSAVELVLKQNGVESNKVTLAIRAP